MKSTCPLPPPFHLQIFSISSVNLKVKAHNKYEVELITIKGKESALMENAVNS